jgi:hypothetical protein
MVLNGVITKAGWAPNKAKTKDVFSFTIKLDDGKDKNIWTKDEALQKQILALILKHVTIDAQENGTFIDPIAIKESEAPKQAPQEQVVSKVIPQNKETDWDMIGRQKARCSILDSVSNLFSGKLGNGVSVDTVISTAIKLEEYVFSPMPLKTATSPATTRKQAPEGMFAGGDSTPTVNQKVNAAAIANLRKHVKGQKNDNELLVMAEGRLKRELGSLEEITQDETIDWLNEIYEAKK